MKRYILILLVIGAIPVFGQASQTWIQRLSNSTHAIAVNPLDRQIVYTYGNGGFQVSYNLGQTWFTRGGGVSGDIRTITVNPIDTNSIVMIGFGIYKSNDGGWTWRLVLPDVSIDGESIDFNYINPDTMFFVDFSRHMFYISPDTGSTWLERSTVPYGYVCTVISHPEDPRIILVGAGDGRIARSTDMGFTWSLVKAGNPYFSEVPKMAWDRLDPNYVFASTYLDNEYSFFRSTDAGLTWQDAGLYGMSTWGIDVDRETGDLYIGSFGDVTSQRGIYRSVDRGKSFMRVGQPTSSFMATWMIKTAADQAVLFIDENVVYSTKIAARGKVTGVIRTLNNQPARFVLINVGNGDQLLVGNPDGSYALSLPPGTFSLTATVSGVSSSTEFVTITANSEQTLDFQVPINETFDFMSGTVTPSDEVTSVVSLYGRLGNGSQFFRADTITGSFNFSNLSSLNLYDSIVINPLTMPYLRKVLKSVALGGNYDITLEVADVLIYSETYAPSGGYLAYYQSALLAQGYTSTGIEAYEITNATASAALKTNYKTIFYMGRYVDHELNAGTHDSIAVMVKKGLHLIVAGQDLVERNQNSELFNVLLGVGYDGDYMTQPGIFGFVGDVIGDGFSLSIAQSTVPSRDLLVPLKSGIRKSFWYGSVLEDSVNIAGVNINNTGFGGKAVVLGVDPFRVSSSTLSLILARSLSWFSGEEENVPFEVKTSVFQNSVLRQYATVVVSSSHALDVAPVVKVVLATDTTALTMTALSGASAFSGSLYLANGNYKLITYARSHLGMDSTGVRNFSVFAAKAGTALSVQAPDQKAYLFIDHVGASESGPIMAALEDKNSERIYSLGPPIRVNQARVEITGSPEENRISKTFIFRLREGEWHRLQTVYIPETGRFVASTEFLGEFKLVYDPGAPGETAVIRDFVLSQNFPNPFNPNTTISYDLPTSGRVLLIVYNTLGQKVRTLYDGFRQAGRYEAIWDGKNDRGQSAGSGIYFYRLQAASRVSVKRMVLLK